MKLLKHLLCLFNLQFYMFHAISVSIAVITTWFSDVIVLNTSKLCTIAGKKRVHANMYICYCFRLELKLYIQSMLELKLS